MKERKLSPQLNILLSFTILILLGTILLTLPFATNGSIKFVDNLFTSTTAVTITGLTTVDVASTYTLFGKIVIAILIKLGGLSITTLTLFLLTFTKAKIGLSSRDLMKENINLGTQVGIVKTVKRIVLISFILEIIGTIIFTIIFKVEGHSFINSLGMGIFHSISSYNNAGLTIFKYSDSLIYYSNNYLFIITTGILIISGGLGTIVIYDLIVNKRWKNLKQHTKIVLKITFLLVIIGMLTFYFIEDNVTLLNSFFHSVTLRTAGFYSYDYSNIKAFTMLIMITLMFIGGSPASTAGGIKVTTLYTLHKKMVSGFKGDIPLSYKKRISDDYVKKAFMTLLYTIAATMVGIILISLFNNNILLDKIIFEVVSAISNTGLTLSVTNLLNGFSKLTLILLMLIGRVSVLTFLQALVIRENKEHIEIDYIDAKYLV